MLALKQFRAIVGDSIRESIDRKSLFVLLALSSLCIIFCAGVSYRVTDADTLVKTQLEHLGELDYRRMGSRVNTKFGTELSFVSAKATSKAQAEGPFSIEARFRFGDEHQLSTLARQIKLRQHHSPFGDLPDIETIPEPSLAEQKALVEGQWRNFGWTTATATQDQADPLLWTVQLHADHVREIRGAARQNLLFGLHSSDMGRRSVASAVITIQSGIATGVLGSLGILVMIFTTAGFIPSMLSKGSLDLILARPIRRRRLLMFKYLGGLSMVFIVATYLVGGCWLALAIRTGFSNPAFLLAILIETLVFAVLYAASTFLGVWSRSGTIAGLMTCGIWWIGGLVSQFYHLIQMQPEQAKDWNASIVKAIRYAYYIFPKTGDISSLVPKTLARVQLSDVAAARLLKEQSASIDWWVSGGSTAAFTLVMLGAALWLFSRRDY